MDWIVYIAPRNSPRDIHRYEVSNVAKRYYAKITAIIWYIKEMGITGRTPFQMMRDDLDIKVKCNSDGRLVDYSKLGIV